MKKYLLHIGMALSVVAGQSVFARSPKPNLYTIDSIDVTIFSPEGVEIITSSDVERPSLTGTERKMDDLIFERLAFLDAKKHKITPDDDAVDKYLAAVQRENKISRDDLEKVFLSAGYTFQEGKEQFKIMQAVNTMLDFKVRSNLIVPTRDIEKYYDEHSESQQARYELEYGEVPFDQEQDKQEQLKELEQLAKKGLVDNKVGWGKLFWVDHEDVAESKQFIFSMKPGEISLPEQTVTGFEFYRLNNKEEEQVRSLDERRLEIIDILRQPKYYQLLDNYKAYLLDSAAVVYL